MMLFFRISSIQVANYVAEKIYELSFPQAIRPEGTVTNSVGVIIEHPMTKEVVLGVLDTDILVHNGCNPSIMRAIMPSDEIYLEFEAKVNSKKGTLQSSHFFFPTYMYEAALTEADIINDGWLNNIEGE